MTETTDTMPEAETTTEMRFTAYEAAQLLKGTIATLTELHGPKEAARLFNEAARQAGSTIRITEEPEPERPS